MISNRLNIGWKKIITTDFLNKARNEVKRTLKLTISKIKNPGSLGANPKRELPSRNAYPTLPATKEETEGSKDKRTEDWVNTIHDVTPSAPAKDDVEDPNARPPNYDQTIWQQHGATQLRPPMQFNPNFSQGMHPPIIPTNVA